MGLFVTFESENLFFRPGLQVETIEEARAIADANNWKIYSISSRPRRWNTDGSGFKPGFNVGLGMNIETKGQYNAELKRRKLVEVGNERLDFKTNYKKKNYFDDTVIKTMNEMGAGISDNEAKELISNG